jgi:hypothetical protein
MTQPKGARLQEEEEEKAYRLSGTVGPNAESSPIQKLNPPL